MPDDGGGPALVDRLRGWRDRARPGTGDLLVAVAGGLCVLVAAVGAVAVGAELLNTWGYYFLMERTIALATPAAVVLLVATVVVGLGTALRAG